MNNQSLWPAQAKVMPAKYVSQKSKYLAVPRIFIQLVLTAETFLLNVLWSTNQQSDIMCSKHFIFTLWQHTSSNGTATKEKAKQNKTTQNSISKNSLELSKKSC